MAREPDPRAQLEELRAQLKSGRLLPGYVLRGEERYFRDRALAEILAAARAAGAEVCRHEARSPEFSARGLHADLGGGGLFASERCVVIEEPEELLRKSGGKSAPLARAIEAFLGAGAGTVVLAADSLRADNPTLKAIVAAGGKALFFRALYDSPPPWGDPDPARTELAQWIAARARALGAKLSRDQVLLLQLAKGNDLPALEDELRLLASGGGRLALSADAAGAPFKLADALLRGDLDSSLLELELLYRGGLRKERDGTRDLEPAALIAVLAAGLRRNLRQALAGRMALDAGADLNAAAAAAGVPGFPAARNAFAELVRKRDTAAARAMLRDLIALERKSRTSGVDASDVALYALRHRAAPARGAR